MSLSESGYVICSGYVIESCSMIVTCARISIRVVACLNKLMAALVTSASLLLVLVAISMGATASGSNVLHKWFVA